MYRYVRINYPGFNILKLLIKLVVVKYKTILIYNLYIKFELRSIDFVQLNLSNHILVLITIQCDSPNMNTFHFFLK